MDNNSENTLPLRVRLGSKLIRRLGFPEVGEYVRETLERGQCQTALDIGCGISSHLSPFRPQIRTIGLDAYAPSIETSKKHDVHDSYVVADLLKVPSDELIELIKNENGGRKPDMVASFGVIEHLPKIEGWEFLARCEALSERFVFLETPCGFCPQGPEFGNPYQKHLSGWFPQDFEGMGYTVLGTTGTRHLRGYMGEPKYPFPGWTVADTLLSRLLRSNKNPQHAFNIVAIKDLAGVPARYPTRTEPRDNRG